MLQLPRPPPAFCRVARSQRGARPSQQCGGALGRGQLMLALLLAVAAASTAAPAELAVNVTDDAAFSVAVGGEVWLRSSALRAYVDGGWQPPVRRAVRRYAGADAGLGRFSCTNVTWALGPSAVPLHTSVKVYSRAVVFVTQLPEGASSTNASNPPLPPPPAPAGAGGMEWERANAGAHPPSIAFPAFHTAAGTASQLPQLGFATWSGVMSPIKVGTNVTSVLCGLTSSGPVALYDRAHTTLVVSPLDNFKSAVHTASSTAWETGVGSEIRSLPHGFTHRTLLLLGKGRGVTAAMGEWGQAVRQVCLLLRRTCS